MKMTQEELKNTLELHKKWLNDEDDGVRLDLSCANLSHADLSGADLFRANLFRANLSHADLSGADLRGANLFRADLSHSNLSRANLSCADLRGANLFRANLFRANLSNADLSGADLRGADLDFSCLPLWCGSFGIKVLPDFGQQIILHFIKLDIDDEETKQLQESLKPYAAKCHLIKNGKVEL